MNDLIPYDPPALLTEREVRLAGATSNRLCSLRDMLKAGVNSSTLSVSVRGGTVALSIGSAETEALIAFLMERDEQFLTSLNIELEQ